MRDWFAKLRAAFLYCLAREVEIPPPFRIEENAYCPACGNRKGKIKAAEFDGKDRRGSRVGIVHRCEICSYEWAEESVSIIEQVLSEQPDEEKKDFIEMARDKRTKNVRGKVVVNGEVVSTR